MKKMFSTQPVWDEEQKQVLNSAPNLIIHGKAGSGKTLLAIYLAKRLISEESYSIAIIVFTKSLRTFILEMLNSIEATVDVYYHEEYKRLFLPKRYDCILVDETQDFSILDLQMFLGQANKGLYLFMDDNQRVFEKNLSKEQTVTFSTLQDKLKFPSIKLKNNYRISIDIANFISANYPNSDLANSQIRSGIKPVVLQFKSPIEELDFITDYVLKHKAEEIGILLKKNDPVEGYFPFDPTSNDLSFIANSSGTINLDKLYEKLEEEAARTKKASTNPRVLEVKSFLESHKIAVGFKYRADDQLSFRNDYNVNIMTYHSAKGLQFDTVLLPFSNLLMSHKNKCVNYVGLTRSMSKLIITYSKIISSEYQENIPKYLFDNKIY